MSATHQHHAQEHHQDACRLDVWLWRARFFKTRGLAARFLDEGRVRVIRPGSEAVRVDKASRAIHPGDGLVFAIGGRLVAVMVRSLGDRRGPATEARALYCEAPH
jgi:ribosome-associated heat shock protein Hsp15